MRQYLVKKIKSLLKTLVGTTHPRPAVYVGNNVVLTKTIDGQKLYVSADDLSLAPHLICDGYWEMWITKAIKSIIKEGMTVVEIGANLGYYTTLIGSLIGPEGEIHAFEANPRLYNLLHANTNINGLLERVKIINKAVHERNGQLDFFVFQKHQGSGSIHPFVEKFVEFYNDQVDKIAVPAINLDDYWKDQKRAIDLIKIDAEGSEPFIISGMKKIISHQKKLIVVCEFNKSFLDGSKKSPFEFLNFFEKHGFSLSKINYLGQIVPTTIDGIIRSPHQEELVFRK